MNPADPRSPQPDPAEEDDTRPPISDEPAIPDREDLPGTPRPAPPPED